ncbi:MAG TPA: hypothetical protein VFA18_14485, partial [Gemmataceae bacterium]|nr:hypothetical protein [Gemmataceae bacterium]
MATSRLLKRWLTSVQTRFFGHKVGCRAGTYRLRVKGLEDRTLLSTVYAANVRDLLSDIAFTNKVAGQNTIVLQGIAGVNQFNLTAAVSPAPAEGATGLPEIAAGNQLTIEGQGALISRNTDMGTPAFRFFDVAAGGSLKLKNLTLANGKAYGAGVAAEGGAIYNQGTLVL